MDAIYAEAVENGELEMPPQGAAELAATAALEAIQDCYANADITPLSVGALKDEDESIAIFGEGNERAALLFDDDWEALVAILERFARVEAAAAYRVREAVKHALTNT